MSFPNDTITIHPIGIIHTEHKLEHGAPIQPAVAKKSLGEVIIFPEYREGLADLEGFERIWILFWCDRAKPFRLRVIPYRDVVKRGLFATRSPSRPNPIGISPVKLLSVNIEEGILKIECADMLDETPLLDIKPYSPEFDSHASAKAGWLDLVGPGTNSAGKRFTK